MQMELLPQHAQLLSKLATSLQRGRLTQVEEEAVHAIAFNSTCSSSKRYRYGPALMQLFTAASLCFEAAITLSQELPHWSSSNLSTLSIVLRLVNVSACLIRC